MKKIILCVAMVTLLLALTAVTASAEWSGTGTAEDPYLLTGDDENISDLTALFEGDAPADTIYLKADDDFTLEQTITIPEGFSVNLDLAGSTITGSEAIRTSYLITNLGDLTLSDSVGNGKIAASLFVLNNSGKLTVNGGIYETSERGYNDGNSAYSSCVFRNAGGEAVINDCTVNAMVNALNSRVNSDTGAEPKVTILGGTFNSKACSTCDNTFWAYCVISSAGEIYIEDADITGTQGALAISGGYGEVKGGNYKTQVCEAGHNAVFYALYVAGEVGNATAVVSGGTFESEVRNASLVGNSKDGGNKLPATVYFTGGTFISPDGVAAVNADVGYGNPSITGGTYSSDVSAYVSNAAVYDPATGTVTPISQENATTSIEKMDGLTYYYDSLVDAVADVKDGETILLLKDATGDGIVVPEGSNFTIDFGGHTYRITSMVGSTGTKTNGMQLLKDSNLTFKNGTIARSATGTRILIQNYSNLTLEDMTLDGTTGNSAFLCDYVLSNNYGDITLKGNTNINAPNVAFDVCYWPNSTYSNGVSVTVDESMTGVIDGDVEISTYSATEADLSDLLKLNINGGTFEGEFNNITAEVNDPTIAITAGSFTDDISAYVADGYTMVQNSDGANVVLEGSGDSAITGKIAVEITPGADANTYDIMLTADDGKYINRLSSAELRFALNVTDGAVDYEIVPAENINIVDLGEDTYGFYFDGQNEADATGQSLCIGSVVFTGYGSGAFACIEYPDAKVNTAEYSDNIVDTYIPNGDGANTGLLTFGEAIELNLQPETSVLTINVNFPNAIENNSAAYQQMRATISGGTLTEPKVIEFGDDKTLDTETETFSFDADTCTYTYTGAFVKNLTYNVTIEGEGYRTARYTVNLNEDKTLSFWNNVMDSDKYVETVTETGDEVGEAYATTYLAGDIVMNNKIDIYDLSAVVAYFGEVNLDTDENMYGYAKYDLNRDGKIDSKDVAMVLVSWGK